MRQTTSVGRAPLRLAGIPPDLLAGLVERKGVEVGGQRRGKRLEGKEGSRSGGNGWTGKERRNVC